MPLELQVSPPPPTPQGPGRKQVPFPLSTTIPFFRVALVWRQGRREERSGCGQAWGGAEARLSLGRPGLPAADMSAPPEPPPPGRLGTSWAHRPRRRPQPLRGKLTRGDGGSVPVPKALPPALPVTPGARSPHPLLPGTTLPPPSPPAVLGRAAETAGDLGAPRAGRGWGKGKGGNSRRKRRILYPLCEEGKVLPPTCSLLLLASARHRWTITYRFPTSAANTWERISPPGAPPRLGRARPSYLTAQAGPFREVIGAAREGGRALERKRRL